VSSLDVTGEASPRIPGGAKDLAPSLLRDSHMYVLTCGLSRVRKRRRGVDCGAGSPRPARPGVSS